MSETHEPDWKDLEDAWKSQSTDVDFSEEKLQSRLRGQRVALAFQTVAEVTGFVLTVLLAVWMIRHSVASRFGEVLLVWLFPQAAIVLWLRRRERTWETDNVLDRLDASIERDDRVVMSMRLGSVMGMIALGSMIMAWCASVSRHVPATSPATLMGIALLAIYVFAAQIAILVYSRRVRRRRKRFEAIRRVLRAPE